MAEGIDNVKEWMKELVREGYDVTKYIKVSEDSGMGKPDGFEYVFRFSFYTKLNEYHVVAVDKKDEKGNHTYLGCVSTSRLREAGEDWNRGRDLADGEITRETWFRIKNDVIYNELDMLSDYILKEECGICEDKCCGNEQDDIDVIEDEHGDQN